MFRMLLAVSLCALVFPALAQVDTNTAVDVRSDSSARNEGVSTTFNSYGTPLAFVNSVNRLDTNQAQSAASSFATNAVWRCATSGWGLAAQAVGGGLSLAGKGGESVLCAGDFAAAYTRAVYAMPAGEQRDVAIRIGCNAEMLADAWEGSSLQCPDMRDAKARREQRWERQRQSAERAAVLMDAQPVVASRANLDLLP